jgi:hypothetical protein
LTDTLRKKGARIKLNLKTAKELKPSGKIILEEENINWLCILQSMKSLIAKIWSPFNLRDFIS